jgi:hypothetical protein
MFDQGVLLWLKERICPPVESNIIPQCTPSPGGARSSSRGTPSGLSMQLKPINDIRSSAVCVQAEVGMHKGCVVCYVLRTMSLYRAVSVVCCVLHQNLSPGHGIWTCIKHTSRM